MNLLLLTDTDVVRMCSDLGALGEIDLMGTWFRRQYPGHEGKWHRVTQQVHVATSDFGPYWWVGCACETRLRQGNTYECRDDAPTTGRCRRTR